MSFQTSISGCPPNNTFIYTTTTVSATNGSFENLSATNASIVNLTTTTFSPVNINTSNIIADTISASSISVTTINSSLSTTVDLIATSGTINSFYSGFIESVGANISDLTVEDITVNNRLLIPDQTNVGLASYMERDANILKLAGSLLASDADPNIEFYTNEGTGNPKLKIPAGSDIVEVRSLNVVGLAEANQVNCDDLNSAYIINLSTITTDRVLAQTLKGNISENLIAGAGINLSTVSGVTTITNTGIVTDPLTIGTINVSNLSADHIHVSNISLDGILGGNTANLVVANIQTGNISTVNSSTVDTQLLYIDDTNTGDTTSLARANNILNLTGTTLNSSIDMNFFLSNPATRFPIMTLNGNLDAVDINGDLRVTGTIDGDISPNLAAGSGISLSTAGGITTIGNIAQTSDPLNLSTLNSSTINSSHLNNASVITTDGLITSTMHCSSLNSSQHIQANNISFTGGIVGATGSYLLCPDIASVSIAADDINISSIANISTLNVQTQLTSGNASFINNISVAGAITATSLTADISSNLASAAGITLSTVNGLTTISSNALSQSTQYAFQATSNLNNNQTVGAGTLLTFNVIQLETTPVFSSGYDTGGARYYIPPGAGGAWTFGMKCFINTAPTSFRLGIYQNGALIAQGGYSSDTTESFDVVCQANPGDYFWVMGVSGGASVYMSAAHSWFYGYRLEAVNNSVGITTDLTVADLNATDIGAVLVAATDVIATTLTSATTNTSTLNASTINGNIGGNLAAGSNITLNTTGGITTISAAAGLTHPLNISNLNVSVDANISTATISTLTVQAQLTAGNSSFSNISASGDITATTLTADISPNLVGGADIALATVAGITTINFTGGSVSDPLNLSTLNASTGNFSTSNASTSNASTGNFSTLNASQITGFTKSTQHAFQTTSNVNNNQSISAGVIAAFNAIEFCVPSVSAYNTATYTYTCPVAGLYNFGFKIFVNTITGNFRMAIFKNAGILLGMGGVSSEASEAFNVVVQMAAGDTVYMSAITGTALVYMAPQHSWWYGYLLEPDNAVITSTTDLTVADLTTTDLTATTAEIVNLSSPLVGASRYYSRRQTFSQSPGNTNTDYYQNYDTLAISNPHVSWATPNLATGGANTGFLIQTAGTYRIEFTFNAHSVSYNNRVNWFAKLFKNGVTFDANQYAIFTYTRGDNTSFSQWSTANTFCIVPLAVGDYIHTVTTVAKNSPIHNNDWSGIEAAWGGTCSFEFLG